MFIQKGCAAEKQWYFLPSLRVKLEQKTDFLFWKICEMVCTQICVSVCLPVYPVLERKIQNVSFFPLY